MNDTETTVGHWVYLPIVCGKKVKKLAFLIYFNYSYFKRWKRKWNRACSMMRTLQQWLGQVVQKQAQNKMQHFNEFICFFFSILYH